MGFDLKLFIVTNLINGVKNGTFTKEYVNITAVNYLLKGVLTEDNVVAINTQIEIWETEQAALKEIVVTEPVEETEELETEVETEPVEEVESETGTESVEETTE